MKTSGIGRMLIAVGAAAALLGLSLTGTAGAAWASQPVTASKPADKGADKSKDDGARDKIIFRSGKEASGKILEETDTTIKMLVIVGGIKSETVYSKADILTIERAPKADASKDPKADATKDAAKKPDASGGTDASKKTKDPAAGKEQAAKVYLIELKGEFGRDVSATPLRAIVDDARKFQPDVLLVKMDTDFKIHGEEQEPFAPGGKDGAFDQQLETARQLQTILTDEIRDNPEWKTKPRLVCWVKRALGGAAFLPFVFPDIFYTGDGLHGGVGYLDHLFDGVGDDVVRQKQRSLRLGRAEGLANKGGHNPIILRAMAMSEMVLSVKYEGGKPIFFEREPQGPDEELLTDDASPENGHRDTLQDVVRMKGNDNLNLNAELAYKLGVSEGTADTIEDLMYKLEISRNYTLASGRSKEILEDWSRQVREAERGFMRKIREQRELRVSAPGGVTEQQRYLGTRIRLLTEARDLVERYAEAIDQQAIGPPDQVIGQINILIEQLKQQLRNLPRR